MNKAIVLAKERYDADAYAVLSDNAFNMQSMGAFSQSVDSVYSTCNAHFANLLAGDIVKASTYSTIMKKVMSVQKDFKRTPLAGRLSKAGGSSAVLSCTTRWTSQRGAAESFIKNLIAMKTVVAACDVDSEIDPEIAKPKATVTSLLFNANFVEKVKTLLEMLNPVAKLTNVCQKSSCSAADAAEQWLKLYDEGPVELRVFWTIG